MLFRLEENYVQINDKSKFKWHVRISVPYSDCKHHECRYLKQLAYLISEWLASRSSICACNS